MMVINVQYRKLFLEQIAKYESLIATYEGEDMH